MIPPMDMDRQKKEKLFPMANRASRRKAGNLKNKGSGKRHRRTVSLLNDLTRQAWRSGS